MQPEQLQYRYRVSIASLVQKSPAVSLQNYEYYHIEATSSNQSLKEDAPVIPTIGQELSEAL